MRPHRAGGGGGALLASKSLLEQLGDDEAERLGLDTGDLVYRSVGELPDAGEKAVRDAGGIPVDRRRRAGARSR